MDSPPQCPECGRPLRAGAPGGLCLTCLARLGVDGPPATDPDATVVLGPPGVFAGVISYFGDYELMEELGRGGMGVVYRARQVSLDRPVAVKMILAGPYASEEFLRRFRTEAETIAQFHHPNIVAIYEVGEHQHQPYFSMEFVAGATLAERVRSGPLPPREAARTLAAVARAVQHAHDLGVLHRDLKPSNILLDPQGQPRVTDFGVAKRLREAEDFTQTGQTLGTPAYIPPEQIGAKRGAVTVRSDVYSLGAILYHVLTGRPPFRGETIAETLQSVLEQEPPAPRSLDASLPADLETICLRCLAKEPARRYTSAAALADDLDRWLEGKPIQARRVSLAERAWMWAKRKPAIAALSALSVLALLGGAVGVTWEWRVAEYHRREEEAGRQAMKTTTTRIQGRDAERLFAEQRSQEAIATLAASLRFLPTNHIAASRLVSALSQRSFALPATPALTNDSQPLWAGFTPNGARVLTLGKEGQLGFWDPAVGQAVSPALAQPEGWGNLAFSEDGTVLLAIHTDKMLVLRNALTGEELQRVPVPGLSQFAALSPDGATIAAGLTNGTVLLIDRAQTANRRELAAHQGAITALEFSRDRRFLVTAAEDGFARVWAAGSNFTPVAELKTGAPITYAVASPDGRRVVTVFSNACVTLWDIPSGRAVTNLTLPATVQTALFSPDSARLGLGLWDGTVRLLDAATGHELLRRDQQTKVIYGLDFSPDGQHVASASDDATVQVWDVHSGALAYETIPHGNSASVAQFSPDGLRLLTATLHTAAHLWELRPGAAVPVQIRDRESVRVVAFSPPPVELLTVSSQGAVRAWNPRTAALLRTIREPGEALYWATFDATARRVILANTNSQAVLLDLPSGRTTPLAGISSVAVIAHAFSPGGSRVAIADAASIFVCDAATGQLALPRLECRGVSAAFPHQTFSLCFSPDGRQLLAACYDLHARLWDLKTGAVLADFVHDGPVASAEFSPDGARFLTASFDNKARIWSVTNTVKPLLTFQHRERPNSARYSPDGRRVLTSTFGNAAFVWDALTGARLTPALSHRRWVHRGLFSPDSAEVLTRSDDGTFRRWDAVTGLPMGEPYLVGPSGARAEAAAASGWDWFAAATDRPEVSVWHEEPWPLPVPDWLPELAAAVAGLRLEPAGAETPVPATELLRLKARFAATNATDAWTRWGKWFLADRSTRTVAWDSDVTVPAQVESLLAADTLDALRQAVRFSPTNALALAHLARATLADTNNPCRLPEADFLSQRAVELAPGSVEVRRLRDAIAKEVQQAREANGRD